MASPPPIASSSSDEGPEELNGFPDLREKVSPRDLDRMRGADDGAEAQKSPRRRRPRSQSRQNSVHDLVDLWGGGQPEKEEKLKEKPVLPTKLSDKRRSAIVSPSYMKSRPSMPGSSLSQGIVAPTPLVVSHSTSTGRPLPRPPSSQQHRKEPSVITPSTSAMGSSTSQGRARPASMFINPVSRTAPLETTVSHSSTVAEEPVQLTDEKSRRARRTSISDMVQRYEAISTTGKPPSVATKPAGLSVKAVSLEKESSSSSVPSPSAAATRFPKLSPTSSPVLAKASLATPEEPASNKGRTSPAPRTSIASSRPSTSQARPSEQHFTGTSGGGGGVPPRKSISELTKPAQAPAASNSNNTGNDEATNADVRDPSPERPYQGVSKLIDRWQRVAGDQSAGTANRTTAYGGFVPRKPGVANAAGGR